jgi:hypothetical protein
MKKYFLIFLYFCLFAVPACRDNKTISRSIYYWRSNFELSSSDVSFLNENQISKIYLRLFDIKWNASANKSKPEGMIHFTNDIKNFKYVPVVYITNETFLHDSDPVLLAKNSSALINEICKNHFIRFDEIQIDCDWTLKTKESYFHYLKKMKSLFPSVIVSASIRLHQIKYSNLTGIPPVDRGMLMFYNMGSIEKPDSKNSIFDEETAKKYLDKINRYSLPLDAALPAFSWLVHYRNGKPIELISEIDETELANHKSFLKYDNQYMLADTSFFYHTHYFMKNDLIKSEIITSKDTKRAAQILAPLLNTKNLSVSLFSLNSQTRKHYEKDILESIYSYFR